MTIPMIDSPRLDARGRQLLCRLDACSSAHEATGHISMLTVLSDSILYQCSTHGDSQCAHSREVMDPKDPAMIPR